MPLGTDRRLLGRTGERLQSEQFERGNDGEMEAGGYNYLSWDGWRSKRRVNDFPAGSVKHLSAKRIWLHGDRTMITRVNDFLFSLRLE